MPDLDVTYQDLINAAQQLQGMAERWGEAAGTFQGSSSLTADAFPYRDADKAIGQYDKTRDDALEWLQGMGTQLGNLAAFLQAAAALYKEGDTDLGKLAHKVGSFVHSESGAVAAAVAGLVGGVAGGSGVGAMGVGGYDALAGRLVAADGAAERHFVATTDPLAAEDRTESEAAGAPVVSYLHEEAVIETTVEQELGGITGRTFRATYERIEGTTEGFAAAEEAALSRAIGEIHQIQAEVAKDMSDIANNEGAL